MMRSLYRRSNFVSYEYAILEPAKSTKKRCQRRWWPMIFHGVPPLFKPQDESDESDEFRLSFILPDIFDNGEVEIEISSTVPPLLSTSPMQRQVGTRRGVFSTVVDKFSKREVSDPTY